MPGARQLLIKQLLTTKPKPAPPSVVGNVDKS